MDRKQTIKILKRMIDCQRCEGSGCRTCDNFVNSKDEAEALETAVEILRQGLDIDEPTCLKCKYHFMSDWYLECHKYNRINNDKICEDFEEDN